MFCEKNKIIKTIWKTVFGVTIFYKFNDEQINKTINLYSLFVCDNPFKGIKKSTEKNIVQIKQLATVKYEHMFDKRRINAGFNDIKESIPRLNLLFQKYSFCVHKYAQKYSSRNMLKTCKCGYVSQHFAYFLPVLRLK